MENDGRTHLKDQIGKPVGADLENQRLDLRGKSVAEIASLLERPPIGSEDGIHDQPSHTSRVALPSQPDVPEPSGLTDASPITPRIADAAPMAAGIGDRQLDLKPVPVENRAHRLPHGPDVPEPPTRTRQRPAVGRTGRLPFVVLLTAIVAIGVTVIIFPGAARKWWGDISGLMAPLLEGPSPARTPTRLPRLIVKAQKGFVNEPLPLGVSLDNASGGEKVILAGLAIGTSLSAGTPLGLTSWQMSARELNTALVYAPKDFIGHMVAAIDLRSPSDWLMDSQTVRLEWIQRNDQDARSARSGRN